MCRFSDCLMFWTGVCFGALVMCCMTAVLPAREEREVMAGAGGNREQDCKPCDQYDETVGENSDLSRTDVSAASERG